VGRRRSIMYKVIYRYILKEISVPFFTGLLVLTFVMFMQKLLRLIELVLNKGVNLSEVMKIFFYIIPSFLANTIPMALLLGIIMAFSRFSTDNEITALKASGIGIHQLLLPVLLFSFLAYIFTSALMIYALPWGDRSLKNLLYSIAKTKATIDLKERIFNRDFDGMVFYVENLSIKGKDMEGIFIFDKRNPQEPSTILAEKGFVITDPKKETITLRLIKGSIHQKGKKDSTYRRIDFDTYDLKLDFQKDLMRGRASSKSYTNTLRHLKDEIKKVEAQILKARNFIGDKRKRILNDLLRDLNRWKIELYKIFSIPFSCLIMAFLGLPLGIYSRQSGRWGGFIWSFIVFFIYYMFIAGGEIFGSEGIIPPFIATWIPNIIFAVIGLYLLIKTANESPVKILLTFNHYLGLSVKALKDFLEK